MSLLSLYKNLYFDIAPGHTRRPKAAIRWNEDLPTKWQAQIVAPLYFDHYIEYEIAAERIIGRDEDDAACFCTFSYVQAEAGPEYRTWAETLKAWRLRDGRWLTYRVVVRNGQLARGRGFYTLGNSMPR